MPGTAINPIELSLFASRIAAVCDEMGAVLGRTAFSPNVRDRLDYSCALFDPEGRLLGQATHIPVHLGSMAFAMQGLVSERHWRPGDVLVVNDPFSGGTHLPDVTLIEPVWSGNVLVGFAANRAHHADIGAEAPGSMPLSTSLEQEGLVIPPTLMVEAGRENAELMAHWLHRVARPDITRGDLAAQRTANHAGARRLSALVNASGVKGFRQFCDALQRYAARLAEHHVRQLPEGAYRFEDILDDDGCGHDDLVIRARVDIADGGVTVDFSGSSEQVAGNVNAPLPVTAAAVHYVFRCLMPDQIPACHGAMQCVELRAPEGSIVHAKPPAAVAAGNVETSTRIVDVVCGALAQALPDRIPAASQGTMNNLAMGSRGEHAWDYYETLGGGAGAGPHAAGRSGRQTHMTNTLNTPVEVIERHYPLRVESYGLRSDSGGNGRYPGGKGVVRSYRFLADAEVSLLTERRRHAPWGLQGGGAGCVGRNLLDGEALPGKCVVRVRKGQLLTLETPGGGGFG